MITFPDQDVFELRIYDVTRGLRLVGAVELVSPGNKDRPENRQAFVVKCAGYLRERVGLIIVDVDTNRRAKLQEELLHFLASNRPGSAVSDLYAVAYHEPFMPGENGHAHLETWPVSLEIARPLPTLPLWLQALHGVPRQRSAPGLSNHTVYRRADVVCSSVTVEAAYGPAWPSRYFSARIGGHMTRPAVRVRTL